MQLLITLITCAQGAYLLLIVSLPMALYNINLLGFSERLAKSVTKNRLVRKEYKVYALFRKDYKKGSKMANWSMVKCVFYGILCITFFLKYYTTFFFYINFKMATKKQPKKVPVFVGGFSDKAFIFERLPSFLAYLIY